MKKGTMKAIRVRQFGDPEVLRLEEVPMPQPGPGEVLVRMHAIGVNPVETYIRAGTYARLLALPYKPGNDGAGVVEQIGDSVTEFKPGDRVYTAGSNQRRVCRVCVVQDAAGAPRGSKSRGWHSRHYSFATERENERGFKVARQALL
jgi:NADPH:quinone reductase-like Zn-dependent oxidoreductase